MAYNVILGYNTIIIVSLFDMIIDMGERIAGWKAK